MPSNGKGKILEMSLQKARLSLPNALEGWGMLGMGAGFMFHCFCYLLNFGTPETHLAQLPRQPGHGPAAVPSCPAGWVGALGAPCA